jgi:hypothetical protein
MDKLTHTMLSSFKLIILRAFLANIENYVCINFVCRYINNALGRNCRSILAQCLLSPSREHEIVSPLHTPMYAMSLCALENNIS